jgi:CheY-like chemotaxis protein
MSWPAEKTSVFQPKEQSRMAATPKVLLAEDDTAVAAALTRVLRDDFDVVDVVADGVMLIEQVNHLHPDVILSDVSLRGLDGISASIEIHRRHPEIPIVLMTSQDDPALRDKAFAAGVSAFLSKTDAAAGSLVAVLTRLLR